jgi:hypothetical protein
MPIKPSNRHRYPSDWMRIVRDVRARSGDCCEGSPAYPDCRVENWAVGYRDERGVWHQLGDGMSRMVSQEHDGYKVVRIVLTVGHLDHIPEHCELANLRHWCQRCHLTYDRQHHAETAYATRKAAARTQDLFATQHDETRP